MKQLSSITKIISSNLKEIRKRKGFSQVKVATALNIYKKEYVKFETGEVTPSIFILAKLSNIYKIEIEAFLQGINDAMKEE